MFFINPFIYAAGADFESIATVTVGSGGASSIEFTSIPGTYQHLQIRGILRSAKADFLDSVLFKFNGASSTYADHYLQGDGSSASAGASTSQSAAWARGTTPAASNAASCFVGIVIDILDYASASKATTVRMFHGTEVNNSSYGRIVLSSALWTTTDAITSIAATTAAAVNFAQHSTLALYGIKAP